MKLVHKFFKDFFRTFLEFTLHAFIIVFDIIVLVSQFFLTNFTKIINEKVFPFCVELLADVDLFLNIILESIYSILSNCFLYLSKISLIISKYFHKKSESIIQRKWELN